MIVSKGSRHSAAKQWAFSPPGCCRLVVCSSNRLAGWYRDRVGSGASLWVSQKRRGNDLESRSGPLVILSGVKRETIQRNFAGALPWLNASLKQGNQSRNCVACRVVCASAYYAADIRRRLTLCGVMVGHRRMPSGCGPAGERGRLASTAVAVTPESGVVTHSTQGSMRDAAAAKR